MKNSLEIVLLAHALEKKKAQETFPPSAPFRMNRRKVDLNRNPMIFSEPGCGRRPFGRSLCQLLRIMRQHVVLLGVGFWFRTDRRKVDLIAESDQFFNKPPAECALV
jgi:hypothetical protein